MQSGTTTIPREKTALRAEIRTRLRSLTATERRERSEGLCRVLLAAETVTRAGRVAVFAPMPEEPDLWSLFEAMWSRGQRLVFPVIAPAAPSADTPFGRQLIFHEVRHRHELRETAYGLWEPDPARCPIIDVAAIDGVLVPGLAFGRDGTRLGRGKAFYDSWLATLPAATRRIGIAFTWQLRETVPHEPHDQRLHAVATDDEWWETGAR